MLALTLALQKIGEGGLLLAKYYKPFPPPTAYLLTNYLGCTPDRGHLFNSAMITNQSIPERKREIFWPQMWFEDSIKTPNSWRKEELNHVWFESFDKNSLATIPPWLDVINLMHYRS